MKKISVIVPCYNVEKVVGRCIESILNQTIGRENLELILVNDASTDNTLEVLLSYEKRYSNLILVINLEQNGKQGMARNIGFKYSTGTYISFIDSDDYIDEKMYEVLYNGLIEYDCDFSNCGYIRVHGDSGKPIKVVTDIFREECMEIYSVEDRKKLLMLDMEGVTCSKLFKKEFLVKNRIEFLENMIYEDNYWWLLISLYANKVYTCNRRLYNYCFYNNGSTLSTVNSLTHLDRLKVELIKIDFCKKHGFFEVYHDEIEAQFLRLFYFNTLYILASRFNEIPEKVMRYVSEKVKENFPYFIYNKYIVDKNQRYLLECLNMNLNDYEWGILGEQLVELEKENIY